ncbi:MAG TPA: hypothetical protein VNH11_15855 [Pirellulales bacterium]|nr:hypothetical protein [Pirellulales bacterium]
MTTNIRSSIRGRLMAVAMGALLLNPLPAWAVSPKTKNAAGLACTDGTCSIVGAGRPASGDRTLGTAIHWMQSPDAASRLASEEGKLVFMIQVSGNFARQEFT